MCSSPGIAVSSVKAGPAGHHVRPAGAGRPAPTGDGAAVAETAEAPATAPAGQRVRDRAVAGAAADVALERTGQVVALLLGQRRGRHDHSGGAEAALEALRGQERVLGRVRPQALDRGDRAAGRAHRRVDAAVHRDPVHVHGAGAAVAGVAALLHPVPALLAQERAQALARPRVGRGGLPVDVHGRSSAAESPRSSAAAHPRAAPLRPRPRSGGSSRPARRVPRARRRAS